LEELLAGLRGEVELPVPRFSAVKIDGRRAYSLARRGETVEMPLRRSVVQSLELLGYDGRVARLDLRVGSGTYVRAIAEALGGHCVTLRRTEVGPFRVEDADEERIVPPAEALGFLPSRVVDEAGARAIRQGRARVDERVRVLCGGELVAVNGTVLP